MVKKVVKNKSIKKQMRAFREDPSEFDQKIVKKVNKKQKKDSDDEECNFFNQEK